MKNKNLITISLPSEYFEKMRELGYTRKTLSLIIKAHVDRAIEYKAYKDNEQLKKEIKIAKTKWIIDDDDEDF